jgi:hypothetical protein
LEIDEVDDQSAVDVTSRHQDEDEQNGAQREGGDRRYAEELPQLHIVFAVKESAAVGFAWRLCHQPMHGRQCPQYEAAASKSEHDPN